MLSDLMAQTPNFRDELQSWCELYEFSTPDPPLKLDPLREADVVQRGRPPASPPGAACQATSSMEIQHPDDITRTADHAVWISFSVLLAERNELQLKLYGARAEIDRLVALLDEGATVGPNASIYGQLLQTAADLKAARAEVDRLSDHTSDLNARFDAQTLRLQRALADQAAMQSRYDKLAADMYRARTFAARLESSTASLQTRLDAMTAERERMASEQVTTQARHAAEIDHVRRMAAIDLSDQNAAFEQRLHIAIVRERLDADASVAAAALDRLTTKAALQARVTEVGAPVVDLEKERGVEAVRLRTLPLAIITWSASPFTVQDNTAVRSPLDDALAAIAQLQHALREEQASSAQLKVKIQQYV